MSDETASIQIVVAPLVPVSRGDIRFMAAVAVTIGGIELRFDGFLIREDRQRRLRCSLPSFRNPRTGLPMAAISMPVDLEFAVAVGQAILEQVPGGQLIRLPRPAEPDGAPVG